MLVQRRSTVCDVGPTLNQHWFNVVSVGWGFKPNVSPAASRVCWGFLQTSVTLGRNTKLIKKNKAVSFWCFSPYIIWPISCAHQVSWCISLCCRAKPKGSICLLCTSKQILYFDFAEQCVYLQGLRQIKFVCLYCKNLLMSCTTFAKEKMLHSTSIWERKQLKGFFIDTLIFQFAFLSRLIAVKLD